MSATLMLAGLEAVALAAIAGGLLSGAGLASTRSGARLKPMLRYGAAAAGALLVTLGLLAAHKLPDPGVPSVAAQDLARAMVVVLSGALMAALAAMDRNTAWAPDLVTLPFCILAPMAGAAIAGEALSPGLILTGLAIYGGAQALWFLQVLLRAEAVPPPDLMFLLAPLAMLGIGVPLILYFMGVAITMKACIASARVRRIFIAPGLAEQVTTETGDSGNPQEAVTFLAVGGPILLIVLALVAGTGY